MHAPFLFATITRSIMKKRILYFREKENENEETEFWK